MKDVRASGRATLRADAHRCPRCAEDVARDAADECLDCLARHHPACWSSTGRCAACGSSRVARAAIATLERASACSFAGCTSPPVTSGLLGGSYCEEHARLPRAWALFAGGPLLGVGSLLLVVGLGLGAWGLMATGAVTGTVGGLLVRRAFDPRAP